MFGRKLSTCPTCGCKLRTPITAPARKKSWRKPGRFDRLGKMLIVLVLLGLAGRWAWDVGLPMLANASPMVAG